MADKYKLIPLVDLDSVVYRCGFASDSNNDKQGEELSYCLHSVKMSLAGILDVFEPTDKARLFLQGKGNYRDRLATIQPYKGNRDPSKRPRWFDEIREYLLDYHGAELVEGMETDDMCGIEQWKHPSRSTCIVTIDKDLDMIPGWHFNYVKQQMYNVSLAEANKKFWLQVLTGDTTDNIRGIPKVGAKTAEKILEGIDGWADMGAAVMKAYEAKGIANEFHENATLLWIQRQHMINYDGSRLDIGSKEEGYEEVSEEESGQNPTVLSTT